MNNPLIFCPFCGSGDSLYIRPGEPTFCHGCNKDVPLLDAARVASALARHVKREEIIHAEHRHTERKLAIATKALNVLCEQHGLHAGTAGLFLADAEAELEREERAADGDPTR